MPTYTYSFILCLWHIIVHISRVKMRRLIIQANHQSGEQGSTGDQLKERIHPRHTTDKGTHKEEEEEGRREGRRQAWVVVETDSLKEVTHNGRAPHH